MEKLAAVALAPGLAAIAKVGQAITSLKFWPASKKPEDSLCEKPE